MWGEVTPAERLRSIARRSGADDALAAEAADALAGFASEPAGLVVACRRVLAHHRAHGTLWWVCARILAAAEPAIAAREAVRVLEADPTARRLAAALPLTDEDEVVAIVGWSDAVDEALEERFDLPAVAVRTAGTDPTSALRRRRVERSVPVVEPWDPVLARAARLLVPAAAIGPDRALVPVGTGALLDESGSTARGVWLVGGAGRVLPARLFDAVVAAVRPPGAADAGDGSAFELVGFDRVDRIVGPRGVEPPVEAAARGDCPVVPELLRPLD